MKEIIEKVEENEGFEAWLDKYSETLNSFCHYHGTTYYDLMPTTTKLAIIQEWLREKEINVYVSLSGTAETTWFYSVNDQNIQHGSCDSYNEALSEGIKEAMKIIG